MKYSPQLLDIQSLQDTQESLALLKILALGNRQIDQGKVHSFDDVTAGLRKKNVA